MVGCPQRPVPSCFAVPLVDSGWPSQPSGWGRHVGVSGPCSAPSETAAAGPGRARGQGCNPSPCTCILYAARSCPAAWHCQGGACLWFATGRGTPRLSWAPAATPAASKGSCALLILAAPWNCPPLMPPIMTLSPTEGRLDPATLAVRSLGGQGLALGLCHAALGPRVSAEPEPEAFAHAAAHEPGSNQHDGCRGLGCTERGGVVAATQFGADASERSSSPALSPSLPAWPPGHRSAAQRPWPGSGASGSAPRSAPHRAGARRSGQALCSLRKPSPGSSRTQAAAECVQSLPKAWAGRAGLFQSQA